MKIERLKFIHKKALKFIKFVLLYKFGKIKYNSLFLNITSHCNSNCVYCDVKSLDHSRDLSYDQMVRIIDEAKELGVGEVFFSGGEALIYPRVWDLIDYVSNAGLKISLVSNGLMIENLSENQIEKIKKINNLLISLESYDASVHNSVRGGSDFFERTVRGIKKLTEKDINVGIATVLSNQNTKDLKRFIEFVKSLGVSNVVFQPVHVWSNYNKSDITVAADKLLLEDDDFNNLNDNVLSAIKHSKKLGVNTNLSTMEQWLEKYFIYQKKKNNNGYWIHNILPKYRCIEIFTKIFVHSDGGLMPCAMLRERANLKNLSLKEALKSLDELKMSIKKGNFPAECNKCSCQISPNYMFSLLTSPIKNRKQLIRIIKNI